MKIRRILKQLFCRHAYMIDRWHFTHGANDNEYRYIEGFEICPNCGKERYFTVERGGTLEDYMVKYMTDRQK